MWIIFTWQTHMVLLPDQIEKTIHEIRSYTTVKLGFHGHNNLEMGLINALKAIENGVELIDSSITGMGRGAGNLKSELILTYLDSLKLRSVNLIVLTHWLVNLMQ